MPQHFFDGKISLFDYRMNRMTVHSIHFNLISLPVPVSTHILETLNWTDSVKPGKKLWGVFFSFGLLQVCHPPPPPLPAQKWEKLIIWSILSGAAAKLGLIFSSFKSSGEDISLINNNFLIIK